MRSVSLTRVSGREGVVDELCNVPVMLCNSNVM